MALLENFRHARWIRLINLLLQAVLFLTLVGGINYLAGTHAWREDPWRYDLTRYRRYSLSPETIAYLKDLASPVRIVVTLAEDNADPEVRGLLREYAYATEANPDGRIAVEYLDIYLHRREAARIGIAQDNAIVVMRGGKQSLLPIRTLFRYENGQRAAFQGEQAITAAILDVSSPARKKVYFLIGHDELRPDDVDPMNGLSSAADELKFRNFDVDKLDLSQAHAIPADASLLIAVAPKHPYLASEQEMLRQYLGARAGRLILFLAPGTPRPRTGLENLLSDWAVIVDDDLLCDKAAANLTEDGDMVIREFTPHSFAQVMRDEKDGLRIGPARTVRPDPARAAGNDLLATTVAASSKTAWGEVSYTQRGPRSFNPGVDIGPRPDMDPPDRLGISVAAERVAARDNLPFSVPGGRLVVIGTGDLISNARIATIGVLDFMLGAVNWTVNRDTQLNIPPRPIERFQLSLSARDLYKLRICLLLVVPGVAALLGIIVSWTRRN